jgi:hypothetical protein
MFPYLIGGECDDFDKKAKELYEEMFGSTENKINETQLNDYLRRLEATKGYPNEWYPPRNDFIRNAIDRAYPSPRDIFNDLAR